jgi:signal transduction histidine kinase
LDFSREGAPPVTPTIFPLRSLIEEIGPALSASEPFECDLDVSSQLLVRADRDQLYRVLLNLAQNAVEAGAAHLRFDARAIGTAIAIEIADDGHGLPPRAQENLFRPFFGSARPGGNGLGLAIARELMRAQGGDIALVETNGNGTTFRLTLPLAAATAAPLSRVSG